ncbi:phage tail protein [Salibacterium aidingense]|uniref:phage tail protein n=1 Tax=Salibacterium aidingense TaxID=384933 RepID=UPI003BD80F53
MVPIMGEIRQFAGTEAPEGWAFCSGQLLLINDNEALYTLIGTTYGGDGQLTFALPDFRGRVGIHQGGNPSSGSFYSVGDTGGSETVLLHRSHLPSHTHTASASSSNGTTSAPNDAVWAKGQYPQYAEAEPDETMNTDIVSGEGGNEPHDNMMPYTAVHYIMALTGIYPSRKNEKGE